MATYTYQLRPGVELRIEVDVTLNQRSEKPTAELLKRLDNHQADERIAGYTREYLQAHIQRAFDSLDEVKPQAC